MNDGEKRRGPVLQEIGTPPRRPLPERGAPAGAPDGAAGGADPVASGLDSTPASASVEERPGPAPSPADAPAIDDGLAVPGAAPSTMALLARLAGRRTSPVLRLFWGAGAALLTFLVTVGMLRFIDGLFLSHPWLGWIGVGLLALFVLATLVLAVREWLAFRRLRRIDAIQRLSGDAIARADLAAAQEVADALATLYRGRPELAAAVQRVEEAQGSGYDATHLLMEAEAALMVPLDRAARLEIEAAARLVAAATAIVPLAFADVAAALIANLRMIRRLAELYGGRAGAFGGWRLTRTVMAHLVATGAVAAGDDLIHTVAGGGALAKLSRRFGEGVINGALTARVGIAAMEVCRPLPFVSQPRPRVTNLLSRGLKGLFGGER